MDINHAMPGDIFVDPDGKLWRVISIMNEPSVTMEEVEGTAQSSLLGGVPIGLGLSTQHPPVIYKQRQSGGVSGLMWQGFTRIYRKMG